MGFISRLFGRRLEDEVLSTLNDYNYKETFKRKELEDLKKSKDSSLELVRFIESNSVRVGMPSGYIGSAMQLRPVNKKKVDGFLIKIYNTLKNSKKYSNKVAALDEKLIEDLDRINKIASSKKKQKILNIFNKRYNSTIEILGKSKELPELFNKTLSYIEEFREKLNSYDIKDIYDSSSYLYNDIGRISNRITGVYKNEKIIGNLIKLLKKH